MQKLPSVLDQSGAGNWSSQATVKLTKMFFQVQKVKLTNDLLKPKTSVLPLTYRRLQDNQANQSNTSEQKDDESEYTNTEEIREPTRGTV